MTTTSVFSTPPRWHPIRRRQVIRERRALMSEASRAYMEGIKRFGSDHRSIRHLVVRRVGSDVAVVFYSWLDQRVASHA